MSRVLLCVAAACIAITAGAQQPTGMSSSPGLEKSGPSYDSAFDTYRAYQEQNVADWRAVNDEVARIGGHLGIVGGAGRGAPAATMSPPGPTEWGQSSVRGAPAPGGGGHAGHH